MTSSRLFVRSMGGAILTSAIAAVWFAPGAAFAAPATETLSVTGTVQSVVVDPQPGTPSSGTEQERSFVKVDDLLLPVPSGSLIGADSGQRATVQLHARAGTDLATALADAAETTPAPASSSAGLGSSSAAVVGAGLTGSVASNTAAARVQSDETQAVTIGSHKLTVLPVFWSAKDTQTQSSLTTLANQAKSYWAEQSNGGIAINVDVRDWKQVATPSGNCNTTAILQSALAANGVPSPGNPNEHVALYFPYQSACGGWAGLGSVNGSMIWINGAPLEDVLAHEFGHNLGLGHANKAACTTSGARVSFSNSCTVSAYADTTDVMGYAMGGRQSGNLNSAFGDYLGIQHTVTASTSQKTTVDLSALSAHSGTTGVKIATSAGTVFVDFRPAVGRDIRAPAWAGVQVRLRTATTPPTTELLDMQPRSTTAFSAVSLPVDSGWLVPDTNLTVKVTSVNSTTATVEVAAATDTTVPTVAPAIVAAATPTNAASPVITWTPAVDRESGIAAYRVMVNGTTAAQTDGTTLTAHVPLIEGNNSVVVVGVNGAGLVRNSPAKAILRDSTAPAAVTGLKVAADGRTVTWIVAADRGTTRSYSVRVDGTPAVTVTATSVKVSLVSGQRSVTVVPSDAAGNVGTGTTATLWIDPAAPVAPVVTGRDGWQNSRQLNLTWTAASAPGSGIASYTVTVNGKPTTYDGHITSAAMTVTADGTYTVTVVAKNLAGVVSKAATTVVRIDTTAPEAAKTIKLSTDRSKLTWAAGSAVGAPVSWRVQVDAGSPVVVTKPEAPNTAVDGQHTWTITAVDAAGNAGPAAQFTAWNDHTAPSRPTILTPVPESIAKTGPVTVTWTEATDSGSGVGSYLVTMGGQKATVLATARTYSFRPTEGRQTVTVIAVNNAGLGSPAASLSYTYDPTAPIAAARVRVSGTGDRTVLTWNAATDRTSGVAEYVLSLDGVRFTSVPATATTATVTTPVGRHTWTVTAVDRAGNRGTAVPAVPVSTV